MSSEAAYFPDALTSLTDEQQQSDAVEQPRPAIITPENALLVEAGKGSEEALGKLYRLLASPIYTVAARILRDTAEAEDLVHEVFLALHRHAHHFDPAKGSARTWIMHMAYTRALTRRTHLVRRKHYQSEELPDSLSHRANVNIEASTVDTIAAQQLMARLPDLLSPEQHRTIEMHFREGASFSEIAQATGTPVDTIRKQFYRGCARLRTHILKRNDTKRE